MVKKIFILITALAATLSAVAQEDSVATATATPALGNEQIWDEANTAYVNANYPRAIELYHSIEDQGLASAKLYYNMGNAYFKTDDMGHAILYYNKALRLSPGDQDIRYNLDVANSYTKDRIQVVPELFLTRWIRSVRQTISGNAWAVLSLVFFAVMLVAVMAYMLVNSLLFRKIGFFATIVSLLLFVITTSFAVTERRHATSPTEAIVMRASVSVKAAPEKNSTDMFVLHEGTKVRVGNSVEGWIEVTIADGNKGWLEERTIEMID
ncbi:MAG: tetratricopeptide repeat protein [Rikenellaceae bacterium]|nr:tetratricopeptide repeat protein [Rikenellaceae bacterium]